MLAISNVFENFGVKYLKHPSNDTIQKVKLLKRELKQCCEIFALCVQKGYVILDKQER